MMDFDGDAKKDIAVFRPSNGTWYIHGSSAGDWQYQYGLPGDIPVPGDYNGYGRAGAAVFRVSNSTWFISPFGGAAYQMQFGLYGDIPVPGDYDNDGKTDIAVFRPSNGTWYIQGSQAGYWEYQWGLPGDIPVPGDYDGDGRVEAAVFRPSNSTWYIATSSAGQYSVGFGNPGDLPIASDFDGDGKTDIAVYRPSNGVWYIQGSSYGYWEYQWGAFGDIPVPGDYDGDGHAEAAVFRPSNGTWYVSTSSAGTYSVALGSNGDIPLVSSYVNYLNAVPPTVALTNLTHPNLSPNFAVGDTYRMTITGAPNQPVSMVQTANDVTTVQSFGNTDSYGNLIVDYVEQTGNIGTYTQVWSVAGVQATSAVSFVVGQLGTGGTVTTTDIGQTADGHLEGVSSLSITNGVVSTYSATLLDYSASLYYDSNTVGTLFDNGSAINQVITPITTSTAGTLSGSATAWHDYGLQTDHYAVAYFVSGAYFANPFYWGNSCYAETSDCSINNGGTYAYWVTAAAIYVGSTVADQINVPQDGNNIPIAEDSSYDTFLAQTGQTGNPNILFKVDAWGRAIARILPELFLAESVYKSQHPDNPNIYPLPMALQLARDSYDNDTDPPVVRHRTYIVRDTNGRRWRTENPLTIYESLQKVAGPAPLPSVNNDPALNQNLNLNWHTPGGDIEFGGEMEDRYSTTDLSHRPADETEVDYWQPYWATGFNAPGLALPGISIPGYPLNTIPLMILGPNDLIQPTGCRYYGTQGVVLRSDYVGINGDHGPNLTCSW